MAEEEGVGRGKSAANATNPELLDKKMQAVHNLKDMGGN
jgi:hypothetical protein